jgi:energy-coupling factor transporter ATP-binding protein EcfA2
MNIPLNYSLFESSYGDEISGEQIYTIKYSKIPSTVFNRTNYTDAVTGVIELLGFKPLCELHRINKNSISNFLKFNSNKETLFYNDEKELLIKTKRSLDNKQTTITVYYSLENGSIHEQIDFKLFKKHHKKLKKSNISLIKSQGGGYLDLEEYPLPIPKISLELNYGKKFKDVHETIVNRLNKKDDRGIILLHGEPGTGKTTYIKYLTSLIKDKTVIFVPPMMAESLTDPSIIPFLMDYKNSILIIEDAEKVLGSRENGTGTSQSTSNLLNLTDGILGDCLNIQIIATFNTKRDNIDDAFMRKGRLIAEHKFGKLTVDESNILLKHLDKEVTVEEEMALSDIYNIDMDVHKTIKSGSTIGFGKI